MERRPGRSPGAQRQREGKTTFWELFIIISFTPPQTTSLECGNPHFTLGKLRLSGLSHMSNVLQLGVVEPILRKTSWTPKCMTFALLFPNFSLFSLPSVSSFCHFPALFSLFPVSRYSFLPTLSPSVPTTEYHSHLEVSSDVSTGDLGM